MIADGPAVVTRAHGNRRRRASPPVRGSRARQDSSRPKPTAGVGCHRGSKFKEELLRSSSGAGETFKFGHKPRGAAEAKRLWAPSARIWTSPPGNQHQRQRRAIVSIGCQGEGSGLAARDHPQLHTPPVIDPAIRGWAVSHRRKALPRPNLLRRSIFRAKTLLNAVIGVLPGAQDRAG